MPRKKRAHPITRRLFVFAGILFCIAGAGLILMALTPVPDLDSLSYRKVTQSTKIYDRTGDTILYDLNTDVRRNIVPLSAISENIRNASIAIEDDTFYQHMGVRPISFLRAVLVNLATGSFSQGGSTITQQVVKMTLLTGDKTIIRKVHEWVLALKLEQRFTKDEILELYLNNTPYGGTLYGAEAAARAFFGKSAKDVTVGEAAYLAALPQSPTRYSPYGNHRDELDARKNLVLDRMKKVGFLNEEQYAAAKAEVVTFSAQPNSSIIAPHFVFYVREYLEEKYGPEVVEEGLTVITSIDAELQHEAEAIVSEYGAANVEKFNANNAALVAIDPKTGEILSMVGSRDYFNEEIDGSYNSVTANRQPGSSFKPFVYAAALLKGFTPQTIIFDLPTQFSTSCSPADNFNGTYPCYAPGNFDDKFRGPMTFTTALAQSINIPAVKTMYLAGINNVIALASQMGISTLTNADQYGLSLALGAGEVKLLELTSAFGVFANDGVRVPPVAVLKVTDMKGTVLEEYEAHPEPVLDPGVARDISSMLSNNQARIPSYRPDNPFNIAGYDVAAKTGTTNEYRDTWTVGYTPSLAVGVWAGNNDNTPMVHETAGYVVAPMWRAFMDVALPKRPKEFFGEPRGIPENAPPALRGVYISDEGVHDILYWVDKDNPLGGGTSRRDAQNAHWEYPIQALNATGFTGQ
ncbi:MAG: PBP1A family penicillin-binding protein [Candidatus Pacebacteria bacterium]|nr:PBP1A family penicillin-binding protein [Candidatus Paceibacterota bacterium]